MMITFGKHSGKSCEKVVLTDPSYCDWLLKQRSGPALGIQDEIEDLIHVFDTKPFVRKKCSGRDCSKPATRMAVYRDNLAASFWCDDCDPHQWGAIAGNLQAVGNYRHALLYVETYCRGRRDDEKLIIKTLSQAKGASKRLTEKAAVRFFKSN